jgi:hypothetical protein
MTVEEKVLKDGLDVIKEIIENQPVGKEIVITIYDIGKFVPLIRIEGNENYSLVSFENHSRMYINNDLVSEDIKPILSSVVYDIRDFIQDNIGRFDVAKECRKARIIKFVLKKK